jgi:hypothetical protein
MALLRVWRAALLEEIIIGNDLHQTPSKEKACPVGRPLSTPIRDLPQNAESKASNLPICRDQ